MLAADVLQRVAHLLGVTSFLEVTVEEDMTLDMQDFRPQRHAGVLLDGLGDVRILKRNREALQGRPKMVKGGRSATMMYAYAYSFCRRAVVATMDLSASGLHLLRSDHWLADERNVLQVWLDQPAWLHSSAIPLPRSDPRTLMQGWSVAQAVAFLHSVDLDGAAEVCRHNGVNGGDLLAMTAATLTGDLRVSPFLAKKMLNARDCYLDAAVM